MLHNIDDDTATDTTHQETGEPITIGTHIDVIFLGINENMPITGKVDTGATSTSLGVENIHINPDPLHDDQFTVKFEYNNKNYTMIASHMQNVGSADGGTHNRPVVLLSVKFNNETITQVEVNLNNRNNMPDHLLIGATLLAELNVVIDPAADVDEAIELSFVANQPSMLNVPGDMSNNTPDGITVDLPNDATEPDVIIDPIKQIIAIIAAHPEITLQDLLGIKTPMQPDTECDNEINNEPTS